MSRPYVARQIAGLRADRFACLVVVMGLVSTVDYLLSLV